MTTDWLTEALDGKECHACGALDVRGHTLDINWVNGKWVILCPKKKRKASR